MLKQIISVLLAGVLLLSMCSCGNSVQEAEDRVETPTAEQAQEQSAEQTDKEQTEAEIQPLQLVDGVYQLAEAEHLQALTEHPDGEFVLTQDIDMGGAAWVPADFAGQLDGAGHTISNFTVEAADQAGFILENSGAVRNLQLADVTISGKVKNLGGIAAENTGTIADCEVSGTAQVQAADGAIGGIAGTNEGTITDTISSLALYVEAASETVLVGGLTGSTAGEISGSEANGEIIITGNVTAGLLAGSVEATTINNCRFSGAMNTKDDILFTNFCGKETDAKVTNCLWRDNTNSDLLLSQENYDTRKLCVDYCYEEALVEWTPDRNLIFFCSCGGALHNQTFVAGQTYTGLPYTHKHGSLERFNYCFNEDGTLKEWVADTGFDGFDMYMGNDCSGMIYWAWARVSDDVRLKWTWTMVPAAEYGVIALGEYDWTDEASTPTTTYLYEKNDLAVFMESLAKLQMGDAVVTYHSEENHARMVMQNAFVFRDQEGNIDPQASYVLCTGQGDGLSLGLENTTWVVDRPYTFQELTDAWYIPITVQELQEGKAAPVELTIDNMEEGAAYLCAGTVHSNYRITATSATILKEDGSELWSKQLFTGIGKWESVSSDTLLRETVNDVDLAAYAPYLAQTPLEPGQTYTYEIRVLLSNGQEYMVKSFDFTY